MNPKPCWCGFTLAHLGAHLFLSLISFQVILALGHFFCSSSLFFSWPRGSYHKIKLCHLSCYCWMSCLSNAPGGFTFVWFPFRAIFLCLCPSLFIDKILRHIVFCNIVAVASKCSLSQGHLWLTLFNWSLLCPIVSRGLPFVVKSISFQLPIESSAHFAALICHDQITSCLEILSTQRHD